MTASSVAPDDLDNANHIHCQRGVVMKKFVFLYQSQGEATTDSMPRHQLARSARRAALRTPASPTHRSNRFMVVLGAVCRPQVGPSRLVVVMNPRPTPQNHHEAA
jgi:hypothetical protein